ncbi:hypothetical protein TSUD_250300 [Trifolium subterraneum]|nr:hypothetical protein TSUD_250300 [Trifolium subterraneum]
MSFHLDHIAISPSSHHRPPLIVCHRNEVTSVETFPSIEPIDTSDSLTVVLQVSKNFHHSTTQIEEQSIANDFVDARKLTEEVVTPMYEIISNPLVRTPHLNHDASYDFSGAFCKRFIHCDNKPSFALLVNLRSFANVMIPLTNLLIMKLSSVFVPPLPKPPNLNHNAVANPPLPPKPANNVSLLTLIACMIELYESSQ